MNLIGTLSKTEELTGTIGIDGELTAGIMQYARENPYTGEYTFTPTDHAQFIPIAGLTAERDIRINPIPWNYGLITWNGSVLTVS